MTRVGDNALDAPAGAAVDAARLIEEARSFLGLQPGPTRTGRDPVNLPMVHHWCQALEDRNPAYLDPAGSSRGELIAPPGMLQTWIMDAPRDTSTSSPNEEVMRRLDAAGYTSVVAVNYDHEYHRELRHGERVSVRTYAEDLSEEKQTALGPGYFTTTVYEYLVGDEVVGTGRMRILKFKPRARSEIGQRVSPAVGRDNAVFWDGVQERELRIQKCGGCGMLRHPPAPLCARCGSTEQGYVVASGRGAVYSHVTHHYPPLPGVRLPHTALLVELEEGVRIISELASDADPDAVRIGSPVQVVFQTVPGGQLLPSVPARLVTAVGEVLPELVIEASVRNIVSTALASRDFQDVHHDVAMAQERGSKTIFTNILSSNGYCLRFVTDWTGPEAVVKRASIRLGVPNYAGDELTMSGTVSEVNAAAEGELVTVAVRGRNSLGDHVTGTVTVLLP